MDNSLIKRQDAIDAVAYAEDGKDAQRILEGLVGAESDAIPLDWIQRYADDWEDMNYAYENPILGMLEDWRAKDE